MAKTSLAQDQDYPVLSHKLTEQLDKEEILRDYRLCCLSREASLLARRDVLTGKAKFGIIGDGKELPQVAMAKVFRPGDFRAGYYRDQTLLFALGLADVESFFAQLYADADRDPFSGGRQMNSHFATPLSDADGNWKDQLEKPNISADVSSTGGQMARALGLALASKKYRQLEISDTGGFSHKGNEVCFCTIGDASTSEGVFWETVNAAGVLQVPLAISVWDDGYGISVPVEYQTTKESISEALRGLEDDGSGKGIKIYRVQGWDYPGLVEAYAKAIAEMRETHQPALIHVTELTQPQGHSTSGSHERYKSRERLDWEAAHDCLLRFGEWIEEQGLADTRQLKDIRDEARREVKAARDRAWKAYINPVRSALEWLRRFVGQIPALAETRADLDKMHHPVLSELVQLGRRAYYQLLSANDPARKELAAWITDQQKRAEKRYHRFLYQEGAGSALQVDHIPATYAKDAPLKNGYEILNTYFDRAFDARPDLVAFGEDVGHIGDVNQGFAGLQAKYGEARIFDTGIREWTIVGQAIGMAMRGLRPIAEIQYLDYLVYGLVPLTDDLATLHWRSNGRQQAPAIIRTRGHRLEGIWHAGSPLGLILNALRGMYVLTPRNMVQAAGMYQTVLESREPALLIECLNGYRLKERMPENLGTYTVPLGVPQRLREGRDLTLVTYGACVRIANKACELLAGHGITVDLLDAQTLLPFDIQGRILESLRRTNRILFLDEDLPGGATAYMMQQVLEEQGGYRFLDSPPATLTARAHRTPYGSDGDYFTKPNVEDVFERAYRIVYEADPGRFPDALDVP